MRLSDQAKQLLDNKQWVELLALSFEQLINPVDQESYQRFCEQPDNLALASDTESIGLLDPILMERIQSAVVISSGFVYSEAAIQNFLTSRARRICPHTRAPLTPLKDGSQYLSLPQVDAAIARFSVLRGVNHALREFASS